jgi:hypothetical protein
VKDIGKYNIQVFGIKNASKLSKKHMSGHINRHVIEVIHSPFELLYYTKHRLHQNFFLNPILFAICASTFSKLCVTYILTCRR